MKYVLNCVLNIFFICCAGTVPLVAKEIPLQPTTQKVLSIPFTCLENLYFYNNGRSFVGLGSGINPDLSIAPVGRGYNFWVTDNLDGYKNEMTFLDGTTWFLMEHPGTSGYLNHFFHILEHIVGTWSLYGYENPDEIKLIVMAADGHNTGAPWEGANFTNYHTIKALFPNAEVIKWSSFVERYQNCWLCMERALISDRAAGIYSQGCGKLNKMLGGALPDLSKTALDQMSKKVNDYAGTVEDNREKLTVTYLKRYNSTRALHGSLEDQLLAGICQIPNIHLQFYWFEFLSFKEQINIIGNTDILISVHGNGLSHILFLPPNAAAVEIYPPNVHTLDYRLFADARNIDFLGIISNRGVIESERAYEMGPFGNPNSTIYEMDLDPIFSFIKQRQTLKK